METSTWYVIGYFMTNLLESVSKLEFDHTKPYAILKQNDVIAKLNTVNEKISKGLLIVPEQACRYLEWCTKFYLILKQNELSACDLTFSDLLPLLRENRYGYFDQPSDNDSTISDCDTDSDASNTSASADCSTISTGPRSDSESERM
jgi:hypothetical protein